MRIYSRRIRVGESFRWSKLMVNDLVNLFHYDKNFDIFSLIFLTSKKKLNKSRRFKFYDISKIFDVTIDITLCSGFDVNFKSINNYDFEELLFSAYIKLYSNKNRSNIGDDIRGLVLLVGIGFIFDGW